MSPGVRPPRTRASAGAFLLATLALPAGATAQLRVYQVDRAASDVYVVTHRSGLLSFLGHEHAIVPDDWDASLCLAVPVPAGAHGDLSIRTASLVIDADSARARAGLGGGPGPEDRAEIQRKMLDADHLDAVGFPEIRLATVSVEPHAPDRLDVRARLSLHGVDREMSFPVRLDTVDSGAVRLSGEVRIRQRDFGIQPESIKGLVKVSNDVDLHFALTASPTARPCAAPDPLQPPT